MDIDNDGLIQKFIKGGAGREDLASLAKKTKTGAVMACLVDDEDFRSAFCAYLKNEDAKVRKNTAKFGAALGNEKLSPILFDAFENEKTLFVRPEILKALVNSGADAYKERLSERLKDLKKATFLPEEEKHVAEEIRILQELFGGGSHTFTGFSGPCELLLTTLPGTEDITAELLKDQAPKAVLGGVRVSPKKLRDVLDVRTVDEFLFLVPGFLPTEADPLRLAEAVAKSGLIIFLDRRHKEQGRPYRFRIALNLKSEADETAFVKKLSRELEFRSEHRLSNSVDDYEIELRFSERKDGKVTCLLKLFTLPDPRFAYRTKTIAKGLKPVVAATAIAFAGEYLSPGAQVLDPFCGTGTLLTERAKAGKVRNLYGVDIFGEAVEAARINTANAGFTANYINRDFFDFTHDHLFEEVITELPSELKADRDDTQELLKFYRKFLKKTPEHLTEDGTVLVLTRRKPVFEKALETAGFTTVKKCETGKTLGIYILKRK
ncbi:MAG: methyltransferase domain-containing protein [Lachnospiraceae bacterium]|nr:methyltransferase domain-containing protein [Lachnospiraceae bacterium]